MSLKKLISYIRNSEEQSVSMRKRLLLYMFLLFMIAVAALMAGLIFTGVIPIYDERIEESMSIRLSVEEEQLKEEIDNITVQGIDMAGNLGRETEYILTDNGISIDDLSNNIDVIHNLQNSYYGYMNTAIQISNASGVYIVLNATANTQVENAESSRSGVYLRVSNIDLKERTNKELNLYRGIADIGREKGLRMNNQWQLEFDMNRSEIKIPTEKIDDISKSYKYTGKQKLVNMWEEVILLEVPFTGTDGKVYGVCGLELSEALFSLWHPAFESDYGPFITVLAPYDGNKLYLDKGLMGGTENSFLTNKEVFDVQKNSDVVKLKSSYGEYVGVMKETDILGNFYQEDGKDGEKSKWVLCVLTPESYQNSYKRSLQVRWLVILLAVIVICFVLSLVLSRRYVNPVLSGMEALRGEGVAGSTGYSEIDELIEFMKSQKSDEKIIEEKLPENVAILFDRFAENTKKLSPAEWIVMNLYIEGHDISEIPDLAFISMATVRKHNRSIYEKLEVKSRDELMLYIDLFRRSDRLDELKETQK